MMLSSVKGYFMSIFKKFTALFVSAACLASLVSCGGKENSSSSEKAEEISVAEGEFVTNPDEPELGEYTVSSSGIKLYYSPDEYSPQLITTLEKYFTTFANEDYETYTQCLYPDYITEMNKFLEKDYGYDLSQSFSNQCSSLKEKAGGDFKITRIKAEIPEEDCSQKYLETLGETFDTDFYSAVKGDCDAIHDMMFYIMAEAAGEETLLISEFEIVFAEKDGNFYTFG